MLVQRFWIARGNTICGFCAVILCDLCGHQATVALGLRWLVTWWVVACGWLVARRRPVPSCGALNRNSKIGCLCMEYDEYGNVTLAPNNQFSPTRIHIHTWRSIHIIGLWMFMDVYGCLWFSFVFMQLGILTWADGELPKLSVAWTLFVASSCVRPDASLVRLVASDSGLYG